MRHYKQLPTISETLQRIFLLCSHPAPFALTPLQPACASPKRLCCRSSAPYTTDAYASPVRRRVRPDSRLDLSNFGPKDQGSAKPGDVRDEAIRAFRVYIVQPDDTLSEPMLLRDALDARQKDERGRLSQYLRQVREASEEFPNPICKYYDKKHERDRELIKKRAAKTARAENKQLEINWTVSDNDLDHRMKRMKEFLEKGWKVEVLLGSTRKSGWKRKRTDDPEGQQNLVANIKASAMEVDGTRERAEMKGVLGQEVVLSFEGVKKKGVTITAPDTAG